MHTILIYYKYIHLSDPVGMTAWQKELCIRLCLKGRVIIAYEGINGTVEGTTENIEKYIEEMKRVPEFSDINFKKSSGTGDSFPKLSVKFRKEIVTLGKPDIFPIPGKTGAEYISPTKLHSWLEDEKEDLVILDMRNDYECRVGKFENSLTLPIQNFREIPGYTKELLKLKDKKVVAVCTGGVRCEKGTAYLKEELGLKNIYQLHDGIVTYMTEYPRGYFKGSLYIFDGRVTMRTEGMPYEVVSVCESCGISSERYVNCSKLGCHRHFISCYECTEKNNNKCTKC